jgi:hypothetical protein
MKQYSADEHLAGLLLKLGFIELTSEIDRIKGNRLFKTNGHTPKRIYFNHGIIEVGNVSHPGDSRKVLTELELKICFFYFIIKSIQFKQFRSKGSFSILGTKMGLATITRENEELKTSGKNVRRQKALQKIVDIYEGIKIG